MLQELKDRKVIWFANEQSIDNSYIPSGYGELDRVTGGFPNSGLIEIKSLPGWGEIRLLLHYLQTKNQQNMMAIIQSPTLLSNEFLLQQQIDLDQLLYINANSNADALWSTEQCLKSGLCANVLLWQPSLTFKSIRRLNLACEETNSSLVIFTPLDTAPLVGVNLSLTLEPLDSDLKITINRSKGKTISHHPIVKMRDYWPTLYEQKKPNITNKTLVFAS